MTLYIVVSNGHEGNTWGAFETLEQAQWAEAMISFDSTHIVPVTVGEMSGRTYPSGHNAPFEPLPDLPPSTASRTTK